MTDPQVSSVGARWREFHPFGRRCPRRTCPGEADPRHPGGREAAEWLDPPVVGQSGEIVT